MNPKEYDRILERLGWTRREAMKHIQPMPAVFIHFLDAVCEKSGRQYVLDCLAEAKQRMPPLPTDTEKTDPGFTYINEQGIEIDSMGDRSADDDGWPIIGSGGPVTGMRKGDTWHRKK
jgi:hypothetical protein